MRLTVRRAQNAGRRTTSLSVAWRWAIYLSSWWHKNDTSCVVGAGEFCLEDECQARTRTAVSVDSRGATREGSHVPHPRLAWPELSTLKSNYSETAQRSSHVWMSILFDWLLCIHHVHALVNEDHRCVLTIAFIISGQVEVAVAGVRSVICGEVGAVRRSAAGCC